MSDHPPHPVPASLTDLQALDGVRIGSADIVYLFVSLVGEPSECDPAPLDAAERERASRFVHDHDRRRFVVAHVALRLFLSRCLGIPPARVVYEAGSHGKPRLASGASTVEFNMAHSADLMVLAAARRWPVGVDVELVRELPDALDVAATHFSPAEQDVLRTLPAPERERAFFDCWTRKEAVVKATGEGLSRALDSFDVDLTPGSTAALRRVDGRCDGDLGMTVRDLASPPGYAAAGAVVGVDAGGARWREL